MISLAQKFPFQADLIRDLISANRLYNSYHFGRRPSNATRNFQQHTPPKKHQPNAISVVAETCPIRIYSPVCSPAIAFANNVRILQQCRTPL